MFRNYFVAALRNLVRNKLVSAINIVGLALGFAAALLIGLYIRYQYSYESFFPGYESVYRLSVNMQAPGQPLAQADSADFFMAEHLRSDYQEVAKTARVIVQFASVRHGDIEIPEGIFFADPDFFRLFPLPAVEGDVVTALDAPDGLVITRSMARRYFGDEDPLGQAVEIDRSTTLRVLAVIDDLPGNTHFGFRMVASGKSSHSLLNHFDKERPTSAELQLGAFTYFQLRPGADVTRIAADLPNFLRRHYPPSQSGLQTTLDIVRVADVHLAPAGRFPLSPPTDPHTLQTLGLVGLLALLLAVINFVNLMTARATQRAIEVGVRKSAGARRFDLIVQFLGESCLYVFAAMLVAMALVEQVLPMFNALLSIGSDDEQNKAVTVTFAYWRDPRLAGTLLLVTLGVGLLAGAYPAFVLSAMRPVNALHRGVAGLSSARVRQGLVVVQVAVLIALLFATSVIHRQLTFANTEAQRIDRDQVVLLFFKNTASDSILEAMTTVPGVRGVTSSGAAPTNYDNSAAEFRRPGSAGAAMLRISPIDYNYFEFYRVRALAGRLPSRTHGTDRFVFNDASRQLSIFINEAAVRALGFASPAAAIDQPIVGVKLWFTPPASIVIAGVIPDIPVDSVRTRVQPAMYLVIPEARRIMSIRLAGRNIPETMAGIDLVWRQLGEPTAPSHLFLDLYYRRMYFDVIQQRRLLGSLSAVAVILSCLGLFSLSIYTAQRRTREIGVRKAMGASTPEILRLLLWSFSKPVFWASLIAWPIAAWAMLRWLEGFAYRVPLGWWWLPLASAGALVITLLTVSLQSLIAARAPPIDALRYQ